jgi:uncharacterized protein
MTDNKYFPIIIICATVIVSIFLFSRTGLYIKQIGGVESNGKISNTISVTGDGKVYVKPDMAEVSLNFSEIAPTSKEALDKVNQKINNAIQVAKDNGVKDSDITTTNLNIYTEYDYTNNYRKLLGQRATQTLSIKIKQLDVKASKAATVIDQLSAIDNIQINNISFDIEDKTAYYTQARELAYNKAKQKASELSKLAGVKLLKPVSISDTTYDVSSPIQFTNTAMYKMDSSANGAGSQLPSGEINVSANLAILWGID